MIRLAAILAFAAVPVSADEFKFCWTGGNGFALSGRMTVTNQSLSHPIVTETDVTDFVISGTRNGVPIGS